MTITSVEKDHEALTMTLTADFAAEPQRVWELWDDPRKLERWWGPPAYPATFTEHDLSVGGRAAYFMTSPEGEKSYGVWMITSVDAPRRLQFDDAFADEQGRVDDQMPGSKIDVSVDDGPSGGTRMVITTTFPSAEAMDQLVQMGMDEGMRQAVGQMDALLA